MQEASAKLASGQNVKIGYEIKQIEKSLDKMDLDMKGVELDNELKRRVMEFYPFHIEIHFIKALFY